MFTEDFSAFFSTKEHAETLVYTPGAGGASVSVNGVFEADYRDPMGIVQSEGITFLYELAKTPSVKQGDVFVRSSTGRTHKARIVERDWGGGIGLVMVHLEEQ